jgi:hypothetical protein
VKPSAIAWTSAMLRRSSTRGAFVNQAMSIAAMPWASFAFWTRLPQPMAMKLCATSRETVGWLCTMATSTRMSSAFAGAAWRTASSSWQRSEQNTAPSVLASSALSRRTG